MSTLTHSPPGLSESSDYWIDVEVPYNKISEKWGRKYRGKLQGHMETGRLQKRVFSIYFKAMGRGDDFPHDRSEALEELESHDIDWAYNLCSQFEFSNGIGAQIITQFADKAESDIIDYGFEKELKLNLGEDDSNPNKDGLVALYQLCNPDLLKEILIYARASGRYPTRAYKRTKDEIPEEDEWPSVIENLSQNSVEDYGLWYQFEFNDARFVAIEQEDRDGVERQVGNNIEQEPANLIILKFHGQYMDVYSENNSTAGLVQSGVNRELSNDEYEEDKNPITPDQIKEFSQAIADKDKERDEDDETEYEYILTNISVEESPLPNNPEIKLSTKRGIGKSISEFQQLGYDLLEDPNNIRRLKLQYEGWKFNITNTKRSNTNDGTYRELVYGTHANPQTRSEFEELVSDEFGIDLKYESSQ